ncbi:MAG: hypothetical protein GY772_20390, partial [bacterium]|nr:hypothetical protein [bacterium]
MRKPELLDGHASALDEELLGRTGASSGASYSTVTRALSMKSFSAEP